MAKLSRPLVENPFMTKEERNTIRKRHLTVAKNPLKADEILALLRDVHNLLDALDIETKRADDAQLLAVDRDQWKARAEKAEAEGESCAKELQYWLSRAEFLEGVNANVLPKKTQSRQ